MVLKQKATGKKSPYLIITPRLLLREFVSSDALSFYKLNKDKAVMRYTGDKPFKSVEESKKFILNYDAYVKTGMGRWTVILASEKSIIGWCGLKEHPEGFIDLGYRFHKKYWNKGYASEAAQACLDYGFQELSLSEIIGRTAIENKASIKVLEKIGMTFWKKEPCEGIANSVIYRIKNDYDRPLKISRS